MKLARLDNGPEIFSTIQGEGISAGQPAVFIRASRCNLHCRWCDTPYTWNWKGSEYPHVDRIQYVPAEETVAMTVREAAERVLAHGAPGVVITGGEPMMQPRQLLTLVRVLKEQAPDVSVEIETNGTFAPSPELLELVDLFVVSPKLPHSGNDPGALTRGVENFRIHQKAVFKFVARIRADILRVSKATTGISPERIWIMPEGRTVESLDKRMPKIGEAALRRGYNLTDRQHIRLFGDTRNT